MHKQTITIDFWGTLGRSNPGFRRAKYELVNRLFREHRPASEIEAASREVKQFHNDRIEARGVQPELETLYADWADRMSPGLTRRRRRRRSRT